MSVRKPLIAASALGLCVAFQATTAGAQAVPPPPPVTVTVDEQGTGTIQFGQSIETMLSSVASDPSREGLSTALTYRLDAPNLVQGDVVLSEGATTSRVGSDVIRFIAPELSYAAVNLNSPVNFLIFYSDKGDGSDSLADVGLPTELSDNKVLLAESGSEGNNGAFYTPTANQPGYVSGFAVTYHFISDSAVPEPGTWALMLVGFGMCGVAVRRSRKNVAAVA